MPRGIYERRSKQQAQGSKSNTGQMQSQQIDGRTSNVRTAGAKGRGAAGRAAAAAKRALIARRATKSGADVSQTDQSGSAQGPQSLREAVENIVDSASAIKIPGNAKGYYGMLVNISAFNRLVERLNIEPASGQDAGSGYTNQD